MALSTTRKIFTVLKYSLYSLIQQKVSSDFPSEET